MASITSSSLAAVVVLSGFLIILGAVEPAEASGACALMCAQGTYVTCTNSPGQNFTGCACGECAPPGCGGCPVHLADGTTLRG